MTSNSEDMDLICKELGVQSIYVEDVAKLFIQVNFWAGSLEQMYLVDSACLTYSHKYFLGYTKKNNEITN